MVFNFTFQTESFRALSRGSRFQVPGEVATMFGGFCFGQTNTPGISRCDDWGCIPKDVRSSFLLSIQRPFTDLWYNKIPVPWKVLSPTLHLNHHKNFPPRILDKYTLWVNHHHHFSMLPFINFHEPLLRCFGGTKSIQHISNNRSSTSHRQKNQPVLDFKTRRRWHRFCYLRLSCPTSCGSDSGRVNAYRFGVPAPRFLVPNFRELRFREVNVRNINQSMKINFTSQNGSKIKPLLFVVYQVNFWRSVSSGSFAIVCCWRIKGVGSKLNEWVKLTVRWSWHFICAHSIHVTLYIYVHEWLIFMLNDGKWW